MQVSLWGHEGSQSPAGRLVRQSQLHCRTWTTDTFLTHQSALADVAARRSATYLF
ncbi:MAG: hypothetical protein FWE95_09455 [Planctomycetaceae bacterium]|nr:hypothetical protein [Planctomycetaceae bacterium]